MNFLSYRHYHYYVSKSGVNQRPIQLILFDALGTLFCPLVSIGQQYREAASRYDVKDLPSVESLNSAFRQCIARQQRMRPIYGRIAATSAASVQTAPIGQPHANSTYTWWCQVVLDTFYTAGTPRQALAPVAKQVFDDLWYGFSQARHYALYPDTLPTLKALRSMSVATATTTPSSNPVQLGILSNMDTRIHQTLQALGIHDYFQFVLCSEEIGYEKPDERAFAIALKHAQVNNPQNALHVGDDYQRDFLGAEAAGLQSVLLQRKATSLSSHSSIIPKEVTQNKSIQNLTTLLTPRTVQG